MEEGSAVKLTPDLWFHIAVYLDKEGIKSLSFAYKYFWNEVVNGYPHFWKKMVLMKLAMFDPQRPDLLDNYWKRLFLFLTEVDPEFFEPLSWTQLRPMYPYLDEDSAMSARVGSVWLGNPLCLTAHPVAATVHPREVISLLPFLASSDVPYQLLEGPWIIELFVDSLCHQCRTDFCHETSLVLHFNHLFHWENNGPDDYIDALGNPNTLQLTEKHEVGESSVSVNLLRRGLEAGDYDRRLSAENVPLEGIISPQGLRFTVQKGPGTMRIDYIFGREVEGSYVTMMIAIIRAHRRVSSLAYLSDTDDSDRVI